MVSLFDRLNEKRPQQNGEAPTPQGQHDSADAIESEDVRQERLEARLATLAGDLQRFLR
jgi:hypothetical protein